MTTTQSIRVENKILSYHNPNIYIRGTGVCNTFISSVAYNKELTRQIAQVRAYSSLIESGRINVITSLFMFR